MAQSSLSALEFRSLALSSVSKILLIGTLKNAATPAPAAATNTTSTTAATAAATAATATDHF